MDIFIGIVVGLFVLMFLVTAHEFGHFIMARRNGVRVLEFGIGFPPRAIAWIKDPATHKWRRLKKSEWEKEGVTKTVLSDSKAAGGQKSSDKLFADGMIFSFNWLPIGGFCQMDGESAEDERSGTFGHANFWQKTKILFGGVAMNWIVAFVILTILAWTGMPTFLENQFTVESDTRTTGAEVTVVQVLEGSPADEAGFESQDIIVSAGDKEVSYASEINEYNQAHAGGEATYKVRRVVNCSEVDWEEYKECGYNALTISDLRVEREISADLNAADAEYLLGISMSSSQEFRYSTWSAPIVGAGITLQITGETFKGLGELIWNLISGVGRMFSPDSNVRESGQAALSTVGDSVSGPVGIIGVLFPSFTSAGPANLAFLAALISISLACMNVLPIPALDGGRWFLIGLYKLRRKKLTKEVEQRIVTRAMFVLLALMAIVTIIDITRFF